jgi:hypothetical protein
MSFLDSVKNVVTRLENGWVSAAQIACLNPAILAGAAQSKGSLEPEKMPIFWCWTPKRTYMPYGAAASNRRSLNKDIVVVLLQIGFNAFGLIPVPVERKYQQVFFARWAKAMLTQQLKIILRKIEINLYVVQLAWRRWLEILLVKVISRSKSCCKGGRFH